jgi:hypothetical protein
MVYGRFVPGSGVDLLARHDTASASLVLPINLMFVDDTGAADRVRLDSPFTSGEPLTFH